MYAFILTIFIPPSSMSYVMIGLLILATPFQRYPYRSWFVDLNILPSGFGSEVNRWVKRDIISDFITVNLPNIDSTIRFQFDITDLILFGGGFCVINDNHKFQVNIKP